MPNPVRAARALVLALLVVLGPPASVLAAQECTFVMEDGETRNCTFTERQGKCLWEAYESYFDCLETEDSLGERAACELGIQVDLAACLLGMVGDIVGLVTPF